MYAYLHYDVFTSTPFEGNQLAIFPDARGMSPELMQTIAHEMNFSESTFLLPAETPGTDIRMRIFTPGGELPMAGHPTIGTTFALADSGVIQPGASRFVFGLGVGPTSVELVWRGQRLDFAWMDQRTPVFREPASPTSGILTAIGLNRDALADGLPIEEISCGVPFIYVPLSPVRPWMPPNPTFPPAGATQRLRGWPQRGVHVRGGACRQRSHRLLAHVRPGPRRA